MPTTKRQAVLPNLSLEGVKYDCDVKDLPRSYVNEGEGVSRTNEAVKQYFQLEKLAKGLSDANWAN